MGSRLNIKEGDKYNSLTIINEETQRGIHRFFKCRCECGGEITTSLNSLRVGNTKSCGCLVIKTNKTHGMKKTKIYKVYDGIKGRCNNPNTYAFKDYGGRGIKCEWKIFEEFYRDMGDTYKEGLQIDRINNNGNYSKENCRWVTPKENYRNRRNTIYVYYKGKNYPFSELLEIYGINYRTGFCRFKRGWNIDDIINKKIETKYYKKIII